MNNVSIDVTVGNEYGPMFFRTFFDPREAFDYLCFWEDVADGFEVDVIVVIDIFWEI